MRCVWPCDHCRTISLGPIQGARRCRKCGGWTPSPGEVPLTPVQAWRAEAVQFVEVLAREEAQLLVDAGRAKERGLHELERSFLGWRDRVAVLRGDTTALLQVGEVT